MTEVLDARETRLVAVSRENGELLEVNAHLKRYAICVIHMCPQMHAVHTLLLSWELILIDAPPS